MALATHHFKGTLLDTASDPDDTTLLAAQGADQVIWLRWIAITVATVQASSSIALEDGVGGAEVVRQLSTVAGTFIFKFPDEGLPLTTNTLLNATIAGATGVVARVYGRADVRGGGVAGVQ